MTQLRSKQILGDDPIAPKDLTTKEYVDNENINNRLSVEDENSVQSGITIINFIGVDVLPTAGVIGSVDIWIPRPIYVDFFNDNDSLSKSYQLTDRHIATPTTEGNPYNIGDWVGNTIHPTLPKVVNNISYVTPDFFSITFGSTFDVILYDADGVTILAQHTIPLNGNIVQSVNNITIIVTEWSSDSDKFKAKIEVVINIGGILPTGGRFSISLVHNNNGVDYSFTENDIFSDGEDLVSALNGVLGMTLGTTVVTKSLSGVEYYTIGTEWGVSLTGINNINSNSYPLAKQVSIIDNNFSISSVINIIGSGFTGWSVLYNTTGLSYSKLDWEIDTINESNWNFSTENINTVNITASVYDWDGNVPVDTIMSANYDILIDTFEDNTIKRKVEEFREENDTTYPRLESDLSTTWDSSTTLLTIDGNTGLQVINDRLVYPESDFSGFITDSNPQPNYTTLNGIRSYYRFFETNGASVSNGIIKLADNNITEADLLNDDVTFDLSIDNGISWFIINEQYTPLNTGDGTGIRIETMSYGLDNGGDDLIKFTLQGLTTKSLYLRISFNESARDNNKYIGYVEFTSGNWDVV